MASDETIQKAAQVIAPYIPERFRLDEQHVVIARVLGEAGLLAPAQEGNSNGPH